MDNALHATKDTIYKKEDVLFHQKINNLKMKDAVNGIGTTKHAFPVLKIGSLIKMEFV